MNNLRYIAYRGYLRSCNYHCAYCPFAKHQQSPHELAHDQKALARFIQKISLLSAEGLVIQFLPYGEALIHPYYWEALARLTALPQVGAVGCQTNLSFPVEKFLAHFTRCGGDVRKLRLWCTFHGTMTTAEKFLCQCDALQKCQIRFSVGAVGDPGELENIKHLRHLLPDTIYLWVNRLDGLKRSYTAREKAAFTAIDPYFPLELSEPAADITACSGGRESLFVTGDGSCYGCNINHRKLGNFYAGDWQDKPLQCSAKRCSCYLSYALRQDMLPLTFFDWHPALRIPIFTSATAPKIQALFFDLDGTLLAKNGKLRKRLAQTLPLLAQHYPLYIATERPYGQALRLLDGLQIHFQGGIFAGGAYSKPSWSAKPLLVPLTLSSKTQEALSAWARAQHFTYRAYYAQDTLYKITLSGRKAAQALPSLPSNCTLHQDAHTIGILDGQAGKWPAITHLASLAGYDPTRLAYIGDSTNDKPIFAQVALAIALADGVPEARACADYVLPIG